MQRQASPAPPDSLVSQDTRTQTPGGSRTQGALSRPDPPPDLISLHAIACGARYPVAQRRPVVSLNPHLLRRTIVARDPEGRCNRVERMLRALRVHGPDDRTAAVATRRRRELLAEWLEERHPMPALPPNERCPSDQRIHRANVAPEEDRSSPSLAADRRSWAPYAVRVCRPSTASRASGSTPASCACPWGASSSSTRSLPRPAIWTHEQCLLEQRPH